MFALCIESSHARGLGHLFRALNLADALVKNGYKCKFYLNDHMPSLGIISSRAFSYSVVDLLDVETGWENDVVYRDGINVWINDRLDTDARHSIRIKRLGLPLVTFDDRGDGAEFADLHIAGLAMDDNEALGGKRLLRGVEYLILNPDIKNYSRVRKSIKSILVTLGGSDTFGVTVKTVKLLTAKGLAATVIVGPGFQHHSALEEVLTSAFVVKKAVKSLALEFEKHDLAVTGGGITPFEANASGLPCIIIASEKFEIPIGLALAERGSSIFAGHHTAINPAAFELDFCIENLSLAGLRQTILDGCGRIVHELSRITD